MGWEGRKPGGGGGDGEGGGGLLGGWVCLWSEGEGVMRGVS